MNLDEVKLKLSQLPVRLKYKNEGFREGNYIQLISKAQSLLELFGYLNLYWNYIDYGLLECVAMSFGDCVVKNLMRKYIHELACFRKAVTLSEFMKLWPNRIEPPP